ncbi:MAG: hypothetical protein Q8M94_20640, partial [Ignavibacteria bacterium]|nr:hypothetical protein [Ignavibacteria bacterium]
SQQCEVRVTDVTFESSNSLTFNVYLKNVGTSNFIYSHGSYAWTIDPAFLNGGTPTFSLVAGFSDFSLGAYPPSALFTAPNIIRTSSNMPGSNSTILPGQILRLYRFRLQTSASSFNSTQFNYSWKSTAVPYARLFSWNSGSGLPEEISSINFSIQQQLFEENFDYAVGDSLNGLNGWVVQPTASYVNTIKVVSPGLTYSGYPSVSGNSAKVDTTGQDIYHAFTSQSSGSVYAAFLVNFTKVTATGDYFFHYTESAGSNTFNGRVFAKLSGTEISFGLMKGNAGTAAYTTSTYALNTTHLVVLKYTFNTGTTTDDSVYLFINPTIGSIEPAANLSYGSSNTDFTGCGALNLRQGTAANAPRLSLDGIRVGTSWADVLPLAGSPIIVVSPATLSGFSYLPGGGPSTSQSYDLSGSDLTPSSGNISVSGSTNYEVSLNNSSFSSGFNVGYTGGVLATTPIYVRLKAGLPGGIYNGENITNAGGGA